MLFLGHSPSSLKGHGNQERLPEDWKKANVMSVIKKGKEDPGNHMPVSLTSIPGKGFFMLIMEVISKHIEEKRMIRSSLGSPRGNHT